MTKNEINIILNGVLNGIVPPQDINTEISYCAVNLINNPIWDQDQIFIADRILRISNFLYNNSSINVLPLDDGVYDQLLVIYKRYNPNYQVGAQPFVMPENTQNEYVPEKKVLCYYIDKDKPYVQSILYQNNDNIRPKNLCIYIKDPITKRIINTTHKYPELVGTLDKCKFVLNQEARDKNVFNKPSVQIFERDYIHQCLSKGIIKPNEMFEMVGELKYDGVSVEAEVQGNTIIKALSRGDTADNIATDLTPILGGYVFPFANDVPKDLTFGIKFEAVMLNKDLEALSLIRGKPYKNCRNAIIGLFGASDAYLYIDYITLIPLSCSLNMNRFDELMFLNRYYNSGEYNRFVSFRGNYQQILFQVKQFVEASEYTRPMLPYMIDGVVISFTDSEKIKALGRENSVNKYQMAIKFNPKKVRTIFTGYTYNIGKSGDIIPMAHFKPCEFIGTIHDTQTIHSYERFKQLNLSIGQEIDVEYVNEVITYVTKPDTEYNRSITTPPEQFITQCPYCNSFIQISESGKSAKCPNPYCHERKIMRVVDMFDKLGFKGIAEETIRYLDIDSLEAAYSVRDKRDIFTSIGPKTSMLFDNYLESLLINPIDDWKIMSAMCFEGMADEKWKTILKYYTIEELLSMNDKSFLIAIPNIGIAVTSAIDDGFAIYANDIKLIVSSCNIINSKGKTELPKVAITGFRDPEFVSLLCNNGFDASDLYGVTKNIYALIAADKNSGSGKIQKANKYGIPIYNKDEFIKAHNIII